MGAKFSRIILLVVFATVLAACKNLYSVTSSPSPVAQCQNIQQQIMFLKAQGSDREESQLVTNIRQLQKEYQDKGCYKLLDGR
jgi:hypothetical protein